MDSTTSNTNNLDSQLRKQHERQSLFINQAKRGEDERINTEILNVQNRWKSKVVKHGFLSKKKGFLPIFKTFKSFEVFVLENGFILFYTRTKSSAKFGMESTSHRI